MTTIWTLEVLPGISQPNVDNMKDHTEMNRLEIITKRRSPLRTADSENVLNEQQNPSNLVVSEAASRIHSNAIHKACITWILLCAYFKVQELICSASSKKRKGVEGVGSDDASLIHHKTKPRRDKHKTVPILKNHGLGPKDVRTNTAKRFPKRHEASE